MAFDLSAERTHRRGHSFSLNLSVNLQEKRLFTCIVMQSDIPVWWITVERRRHIVGLFLNRFFMKVFSDELFFRETCFETNFTAKFYNVLISSLLDDNPTSNNARCHSRIKIKLYCRIISDKNTIPVLRSDITVSNAFGL